MNKSRSGDPGNLMASFRFQRWIAGVGIALFMLKMAAWWVSGSVAILTDALESIVNMVAAGFGLYSLYLAAQPRDRNHPYGHGKIEFISALIEGTLISVAGIFIVIKAVENLIAPQPLSRVDLGIIGVAIAGAINYALGWEAERKGKKASSMALIASGKHLKTDAWSTAGIVAGLGLVYLTDLFWLDSLVALVFAGLIFYNGYQIIRSSVAGIMDEADDKLLARVVATLQAERLPQWIDLHNFRIIKYGSTLHLDAHLTLPWYMNVNEAHEEVERLSQLVQSRFGSSVELFIHADGCEPFSCAICTQVMCTVRQQAFRQAREWTVDNISKNEKHRLPPEPEAELSLPAS